MFEGQFYLFTVYNSKIRKATSSTAQRSKSMLKIVSAFPFDIFKDFVRQFLIEKIEC